MWRQDDADAVDNDTMKQRNDEEDEEEEGRKDAGEVRTQPEFSRRGRVVGVLGVAEAKKERCTAFLLNGPGVSMIKAAG